MRESNLSALPSSSMCMKHNAAAKGGNNGGNEDRDPQGEGREHSDSDSFVVVQDEAASGQEESRHCEVTEAEAFGFPRVPGIILRYEGDHPYARPTRPIINCSDTCHFKYPTIKSFEAPSSSGGAAVSYRPLFLEAEHTARYNEITSPLPRRDLCVQAWIAKDERLPDAIRDARSRLEGKALREEATWKVLGLSELKSKEGEAGDREATECRRFCRNFSLCLPHLEEFQRRTNKDSVPLDSFHRTQIPTWERARMKPLHLYSVLPKRIHVAWCIVTCVGHQLCDAHRKIDLERRRKRILDVLSEWKRMRPSCCEVHSDHHDREEKRIHDEEADELWSKFSIDFLPSIEEVMSCGEYPDNYHSYPAYKKEEMEERKKKCRELCQHRFLNRRKLCGTHVLYKRHQNHLIENLPLESWDAEISDPDEDELTFPANGQRARKGNARDKRRARRQRRAAKERSSSESISYTETSESSGSTTVSAKTEDKAAETPTLSSKVERSPPLVSDNEASVPRSDHAAMSQQKVESNSNNAESMALFSPTHQNLLVHPNYPPSPMGVITTPAQVDWPECYAHPAQPVYSPYASPQVNTTSRWVEQQQRIPAGAIQLEQNNVIARLEKSVGEVLEDIKLERQMQISTLDSVASQVKAITGCVNTLQNGQKRIRGELETVAKESRRISSTSDLGQRPGDQRDRDVLASGSSSTSGRNESRKEDRHVRFDASAGLSGSGRKGKAKDRHPPGHDCAGKAARLAPHESQSCGSSSNTSKGISSNNESSTSMETTKPRRSPRVAQTTGGATARTTQPTRTCSHGPVELQQPSKKTRRNYYARSHCHFAFRHAAPHGEKVSLSKFYQSLRREERQAKEVYEAAKKVHSAIGRQLNADGSIPKTEHSFSEILQRLDIEVPEGDVYGLPSEGHFEPPYRGQCMVLTAGDMVSFGPLRGKPTGVPMGSAESPAQWTKRLSKEDGKRPKARAARQS